MAKDSGKKPPAPKEKAGAVDKEGLDKAGKAPAKGSPKKGK